jgi:hypothetical protein
LTGANVVTIHPFLNIIINTNKTIVLTPMVSISVPCHLTAASCRQDE